MRLTKWFVCLAGLLALAIGNLAAATTTQVRLVLAADAARPGETVMAGVHLKLAPRWHTYWRNGGDSGGPATVEWTLPPGVTAGAIRWPVPEKLNTSSIITYVLHDEVVLLVPLKLAGDAPIGPHELKAKVSWLECEEVCVSRRTNVSARLIIGPERKPSADVAFLEAAKNKLPLSGGTVAARAQWEAEADGESRGLLIEWDLNEKPAVVDFFPFESDAYTVGNATERVASAPGKIALHKTVEKIGGNWPAQVAGLLVSRATQEAPPQAHEVTLAIAPGAAGSAAVPVGGSLLAMLGFAFIGGLILNIMPCVLPVIALKILGFVNQAKEAPQRVKQLGLIYGLGVLASFLVLAGLAITVQRAGGLAGWGSAFQNPQFRVLITTLITLVALNLFGVFEITLSGGAMGAAGDLTAKEGAGGAFFNGVLATVLATPCTAPFLGVAIGFAFTQPAHVIVLVFVASGLGLAAPFVLLCWQPAWLKFLPKPGAWMERFKVAMGFPMLATAMWLFWLTATRLGKTGVLWLGLFLVTLALVAWVWGEFVQRGRQRRTLAVIVSLALAVFAYGFILEKQLHWRAPAGAMQDKINWQPWSPEAVAKARGEGRPVLVDFTADTCLNCQVNKVVALDIAPTRDKLKEINAVTLLGDYTDENPAIARELKKFGRPGVPLVLVYPKDASQPPIVLPPVLTPGIVLDALDKAAR